MSEHVGRYYVPLHPDLYRSGQPALITAVVEIRGRACFHLRYPDGVEDDTPVPNEDLVGKGGLGVFNDIRDEPLSDTIEHVAADRICRWCARLLASE